MSTITINGVYYTIIAGTGPFTTADWTNASSPVNFMISGFSSVADSAFYNNTTITNVHIGYTVQSIGYSAFRGATNLSSVSFELDSQLTTIGTWAFSGTTSLASIDIPDSVTTIGNNVFNGATALTIIAIHDTVTSIGSSAFRNARRLNSITFGAGSILNNIGNDAFYGASALTTIVIPDGVLSIGANAFYNARSLSSITFGVNSILNNIGQSAFNGATSLTSIAIPDRVNSIGNTVFYNASNLSSITFGVNSQLASIGTGVFRYTALTIIAIPDTVNSIGADAFQNTGLTTVILTQNLTIAGTEYAIGTSGSFFGDTNVSFVPLDTSPPTMTIVSSTVSSGSTTNNGSIDLTFTSNEATTDFNVNSITVTNGALSNFSASGNDYTTTFTPTVDGECTIKVLANEFTNAYGNNNSASNIFTWTHDDTSPILDVVTAITYHSSDTTPSFTFSSTQAGTITYSSGLTSSYTNASIGNNTITFDSLDDGIYTGKTVTVTDPANNATVLTIPEFIIDITAPIITLNGDYITTVEMLTPYIELGATAVDNVDETISASDIVIDPTTIDTSYTGEYTITYTVEDSVGNIGTANRIVKVVIPFPSTIINICFPAGTPVTTDQGPVAIEKLNLDKHTIRGKEIVAITQTRPLQQYIVCFEKDALSKNVPSQQTFCSNNHKVFYKGEMIKAKDMTDLCENVHFVDYNGETLYNVLLKTHDKMMVNNLICETLHPKNIMAKISTMKDGQKKNKVIQELTKIIKENNVPEYQKLYASL